jgi:hypothetical protein
VLDHHLELSVLVERDRLAFVFAVDLPVLELAPAAVRTPKGVVRDAAVAAARGPEQAVTFRSHRVFDGYPQPALRGAVHPDHVPFGVVDDYHVIYFIQYHVEKALCGNVVGDHYVTASQYRIINADVDTCVFDGALLITPIIAAILRIRYFRREKMIFIKVR